MPHITVVPIKKTSILILSFLILLSMCSWCSGAVLYHSLLIKSTCLPFPFAIYWMYRLLPGPSTKERRSHMLSAPNIVTKINLESTSFEIYAYRKLSQSECLLAVRHYLRQKHLTKIPKNKKIKIITIIGSIE